jgi:cytochrome b561
MRAQEMVLATMNGDRTIPSTIAVEERHDATTVALHWLTAVLVFALWIIAQAESLVPKSEHHLLWSVHILIGAALVHHCVLRHGVLRRMSAARAGR